MVGDLSELTAHRALADARSRQVLAGLMALRDGDFSVRLPVDWAGTDGRIAEAFNEAIGREQQITQEAARLSAIVGKEGRLTQRMAVPGAVGGWADKVYGQTIPVGESFLTYTLREPHGVLQQSVDDCREPPMNWPRA